MSPRAAAALGAVMVVLGLAMIVRTLAAGGGPAAVGIVFGVLFALTGAGRIWLARRDA